jgi:integrase
MLARTSGGRTRRTKVVALKDDGEAFVFTRKNGRPICTFGKRWHAAVRAIGIPDRVVKRRLPSGKVRERRLPGLLFHDFRRTAVRRLERAGVARSVAMKLVGHKTKAIYRRYAIVKDGDLREAVEKLGAVVRN